MDNNIFIKQAKNLVSKWYEISENKKVETDYLFVVWLNKIIKNNKAMIGCSLPEEVRYFEVTWDGYKEKMYLDVYEKEDKMIF